MLPELHAVKMLFYTELVDVVTSGHVTKPLFNENMYRQVFSSLPLLPLPVSFPSSSFPRFPFSSLYYFLPFPPLTSNSSSPPRSAPLQSSLGFGNREHCDLPSGVRGRASAVKAFFAHLVHRRFWWQQFLLFLCGPNQTVHSKPKKRRVLRLQRTSNSVTAR